MTILNDMVPLASHLVFIGLTYQMVNTLFDWEKITKNVIVNTGKLRLFLLFISIAIGFLVSSFFIYVLTLCQSLASLIS
ncbi:MULTISPECIES: DUF1146 family protein [Streptococcus]|uniref:DUF1146 family protein n=1 Tax=Streptococcus TaxID=1301 RepID=UPI00093C2FB8|nr:MULTISPECIES: DUF1146 family protein [Streptococcus]